jgi:hypothetical protein
VRCNLLTAFVNQEDELGVGIRAQAGDNVLQLLVLLFIHYDRSRHRFSSIIESAQEETRRLCARTSIGEHLFQKRLFQSSASQEAMFKQGHICGIPLL